MIACHSLLVQTCTLGSGASPVAAPSAGSGTSARGRGMAVVIQSSLPAAGAAAGAAPGALLCSAAADGMLPSSAPPSLSASLPDASSGYGSPSQLLHDVNATYQISLLVPKRQLVGMARAPGLAGAPFSERLRSLSARFFSCGDTQQPHWLHTLDMHPLCSDYDDGLAGRRKLLFASFARW